MTASRPKHAQPCALVALRWTHGVQWGLFGVASALAIGLASTIGPSPHQAAAEVPVSTSPSTHAATADAGVAAGLGQSTDSTGTPTLDPSRKRTPGPAHAVPASGLAADGIPMTALLAYQGAAQRENKADPACGIPWPLLAAIGRVESDHGRFAGAVLHADGISTPRVVGIPLNGSGTALIRDTDHGRLDGDTVYDRAVGPMQFIPSTWAGYGVDANGDGVADPFNIFDAAAAAAHYLCVAGGNLTTAAGQTRAVLAYNHDASYVATVLNLEQTYAAGVPGVTIPIFPPTPAVQPIPSLPPVNPGKPPAVEPTPATTPSSTSNSGSNSASRSPSHSPSHHPSTSTSPSGCPTPTGSTTGPSSASGSATPVTTSACPTDTSTPPSSSPATTDPTPPPTTSGKSVPIGPTPQSVSVSSGSPS